MAAILASLHMKTADDQFGTPPGSHAGINYFGFDSMGRADNEEN